MLARTAILSLSLLFACVTAPMQALDEVPSIEDMLERYRELERLAQLIDEEFVDQVSNRDLWDGAFRGMVSGLDGHSAYLSNRETAIYTPSGDGQMRGFGFDWKQDPVTGVIEIRRVISGGPAARSGMAAGDILVAVEGKKLLGLAPQRAAEHVLTARDTTVFTVRHADASEQDLELTRSAFADNGIAASGIVNEQHGIGYVRISRFLGGAEKIDNTGTTSLTATAMRAAIDKMAGKGMRALIIDLRGNGGGSLPAAVEVADAFIQPKSIDTVIVQQISRSPARQISWQARAEATYPNWPLAVLIDNGTASSAELVAACLQEYGRALIVGSQSTGKNSVQQTFLLDSGAALRLTVARYLTPSGKSIAGIGVTQTSKFQQTIYSAISCKKIPSPGNQSSGTTEFKGG